MVKAESAIALGLVGLSLYFMWHATVLPIGWVEGQGPGGGAFPFWLSAIMLAASGAVFLRSLRATGPRAPFFVPAMVRPVAMVVIALAATVALTPLFGMYLAIGIFLVWYLRVFGRHSWRLTGSVILGTVLVMFFFFEVTAKAILPKGITEPLFLPLYRIFF
jgi:hypothetical protein